MENLEDDDKVGPLAGEEMEEEEEEEHLGSSLTLERIAVAKKFIENHYKAHMKHIKERRERYQFFINQHRISPIVFDFALAEFNSILVISPHFFPKCMGIDFRGPLRCMRLVTLNNILVED